jgi:hypothetical protein
MPYPGGSWGLAPMRISQSVQGPTHRNWHQWSDRARNTVVFIKRTRGFLLSSLASPQHLSPPNRGARQQSWAFMSSAVVGCLSVPDPVVISPWALIQGVFTTALECSHLLLHSGCCAIHLASIFSLSSLWTWCNNLSGVSPGNQEKGRRSTGLSDSWAMTPICLHLPKITLQGLLSYFLGWALHLKVLIAVTQPGDVNLTQKSAI